MFKIKSLNYYYTFNSSCGIHYDVNIFNHSNDFCDIYNIKAKAISLENHMFSSSITLMGWKSLGLVNLSHELKQYTLVS